MKKIVTFILIFLASILLAGCISVPIGGGETLKLSFDGITFETDEEVTNEAFELTITIHENEEDLVHVEIINWVYEDE